MVTRVLRLPKLSCDNTQTQSSGNKCKWIWKQTNGNRTRESVIRWISPIRLRLRLHNLLMRHQVNKPKRRRLTQCINGQQGQRLTSFLRICCLTVWQRAYPLSENSYGQMWVHSAYLSSLSSYVYVLFSRSCDVSTHVYD